MKLYTLEPKTVRDSEGVARNVNDAFLEYDIEIGFVICARSQHHAREQAASVGGDLWQDDKATTCTYLGNPRLGMGSEIVMTAFRAG